MISVDSWWDGLVRERVENILHRVMEAVSDDYHSVQTILETVNGRAHERNGGGSAETNTLKVNRREVVRALRELVNEGYAQAHVLAPERPHFLAVPFREEQADQLWFYVTAKGKEIMNDKL